MAESPASPPQRVSRYRSQRKAQAAAEEVPPTPQVPLQDELVDDGVVRTKSRYHRKKAATDGYDAGRPITARPPTSQDQEQVSVAPGSPARAKPQSTSHDASQLSAQQPGRMHQRNGSNAQRHRERHASPPTEPGAPDLRRLCSADHGSGAEETKIERMSQRDSTSRKLQPVPVSSLSKLSSNQAQVSGELFPPPRPELSAKFVKVDGPPTSDQIRATKSTCALPRYSDDDDDDDEQRGGCFGLFKRKRGETSPQTTKTPIARLKGPQIIMAGGGGIVPGTDAPVSAVNAGDRRVLIDCGKTKMIFPVTPTTTPVDLIKSVSITMSERIDAKSAVLLEHFSTVGVQRPLRRYEHVRDIMNSWNTDRQNSLILVDPGTGTSEAELSLAGVPQFKPEEASWLLSFSQKPGKWDKRLITLHASGQLTMQKDPNKPQNQENICHLSDFDIYTPTPEKIRKKIKPPKKICYAVKSQQKTSMFESTQNFVHFFCTNERATADEFYSALQGWRSWYLVNVMGEGRKSKEAEAANSGSIERALPNGEGKGHHAMDSLASHYQLGSFQPLVDMDHFEYDKRPSTTRSHTGGAGGFTKAANQFDTTVSPERRTSTVRKKGQHPPVALNGQAQLAEDEPLANLGRRPSLDAKRRPSLDGKRQNTDEFNVDGLLGRTFSQKQKEYAEKGSKRGQRLTTGPNLHTGGYREAEDDYAVSGSLDMPRRNPSTEASGQPAHQATSSNTSTREGRNRISVDLGRTGSRSGRGPPKPLVDLTAQYREPVHHTRKGKGHVPGQPGALIEAATSPEDPLSIPPSTDWRGKSAQSSSDTRPGVDGRASSRSRAAQPALQPSRSVQRPGTSRSPEAQQPFDANGLLANAKSGWGGGDRGRPVMDGSHTKRPMLDMNEPSLFVQGSLLNKVVREGGRDGPVIDREKREEREERYGEGYRSLVRSG